MGLYVDLSQSDKDIVEPLESFVRGWLNGIISAGIIQARSLKAAMDASGGAGEILDGLDPGEVIPNTSGIAGAQDLTVEEWAILRTTGLDDYLTTYDTIAVRELLAKAAGPTAGL